MIRISEWIEETEADAIRSRTGSSHPLFLDIETTGLSPRYHQIYLVGAALLEEDRLYFRQWMTQNPDEELPMLEEAEEFCRQATTLVHFNGSTFDLPFLEKRMHREPGTSLFTTLSGLDLYRKLSSCRELLRLPDGKQKTWEAFMGMSREDRYSGGELIKVYEAYVKEPEAAAEKDLLTHNREDVLALPSLLPLLAYPAFVSGDFLVTGILSRETDPARTQLGMTLQMDQRIPFPTAFTAGAEKEWQFFLRDDLLRLTLPLYTGELRYFFPDYQNYYYLPAEDMAVHKSVASYVDKAFRKKATARTAYLRKTGTFLRIPEELANGSLRIFRAASGEASWILPEETLLEDISFWNRCLRALLHLL